MIREPRYGRGYLNKMVKGYFPPEKLETGTCFLCNGYCNEDSYVHTECAISYADKKQELINKAHNKIKGGE